MDIIETFKEAVLSGAELNRNQALDLWNQPLESLGGAAQELREHFCGAGFDFCTIINGKSGRCPENCKYCAQSAHYDTKIEEYPLLDTEKILEEAEAAVEKGIGRFSIVTSGKKLTDKEVESLCDSYRRLKEEYGLSLCASHGLLSMEQMAKLKQAGVSRYHNNLETSRRFFPQICTTHTYDEKIQTIKNAQAAGLEVCSGGIIGLGETPADRVDMLLEIRTLNVTCIPLNVLNPIQGTPLETAEPITEDEVCRTAAVFRFLLPRGTIRLAGGRGLFQDKGKQIFECGANAAISGRLLTTAGITVEEDLKLIQSLGYRNRHPF